MAPLPWRCICGSSYFLQFQTPRKLIPITPVPLLARALDGRGDTGHNAGIVERGKARSYHLLDLHFVVHVTPDGDRL